MHLARRAVSGWDGENKLSRNPCRCFVDHSEHRVSVRGMGEVTPPEAKREVLGISQGSGSQSQVEIPHFF